MKRRIRSIFLLMVVCMVGINGFQAYWLYNTYQLEAAQFARTAREALASVVQHYQLDATRQFIERNPRSKGGLVVFQNTTDDGHFNRIILRPRADSGANRPVPRIRVEQEVRRPLATRAVRIRNGAGDTLVRKISSILLTNWGGARPVNLRCLTADYHAELRLRNADAALVLDTLSMPLRGEGGPALAQAKPARPFPAAFSVKTPPVALNPFRELYVQAAFEPPTSYVLRRMGGLLGGSLLLLALTTGCFLLMLSTILKQKKLSEVKNDFINNMTHELKTPLATVSAAVEAMQHFGALQDPQKTQSYLAISRRELQRLSDLVEKVLNMALEEQQVLTLHPEPVRPAELVQELVARHQLQAVKPVRFEVDIPAADSVRLDRTHVSNVINNLIDNAIKYSREQVAIRIRGEQDAAGWRLTVQDDGIGIPTNYQEAIFDRFFRVPTGNLHPVKGFGLGLYYVRQVVEGHGGRIAVRSTPNHGSEFSLWLPRGEVVSS